MDSWPKFDGFPIELYDGRFTGGAFDMDEDAGSTVKYDDVVSFLVVSRADKAKISTNKDGDLKRTNEFHIIDVHVLNPEEAESVLKGHHVTEEYHLFDPQTGEVQVSEPVPELDDGYVSEDEVEVVGSVPTPEDVDMNDWLYGDGR